MTATSWWRRLFGGGKAAEGAAAQGSRGGAQGRGKGGGQGKGGAKGNSHAKANNKGDNKGKAASSAQGGAARTAGHTQPTGKPGRRASIDQSRAVLGVVATKTGWVGALLDPSGHGTPAIFGRAALADLVEQAGPVAVVAVDVPVGLPDHGPRDADKATRSFVGPQGAAVFTTPVRDAVYAATYGEANALNRERVGSGLARQAYELRAHIMEVDRHVRSDLPYVLVETHPEAVFTEIAGAPVASRRRSAEGGSERRGLLTEAGIHPPTSAPIGTATDDMLDACAAAWTAHRVKLGQARSIPEQPQTFSDGLPSAIHL